MSEHVDLNLYTRNLSDELGEDYVYNQSEIRKRLKPYLDYYNEIRKYYQNPIVKIEYVKLKPSLEDIYKHMKIYKQNQTVQDPILLDLKKLTDEQLEKIFKNEIQSVYQHSNGDKKVKRRQNRIKVIKHDKDNKILRLEKTPAKEMISIFVDTYQIDMMHDAIRRLAYKPRPEYGPLLRLFYEEDQASWPYLHEEHVDDWFLLTEERKGVSEQQKFVEKALGATDFTFLEGPPGSGKTTTLCELVLQLVARKKRVLFCASTHVAVDNLLEKLVDRRLESETEDLIAIRIGESPKISKSIEDYKYKEFVNVIKNSMIEGLANAKSASPAQNMLKDVLNQKDDGISRLARDCANLVCGTTIGILSHPDIKNGTASRFDYMILDEASKTTFQEFLVPALHADRWVIVGDIKQLSPYMDQDEIAKHLDSCISNSDTKRSCLDAFLASVKTRQSRTTVVVNTEPDLKDMYKKQCDKLGIEFYDADKEKEAVKNPHSSDKHYKAKTDDMHRRIIIGSPDSIYKLEIPKDMMIRDHRFDQYEEIDPQKREKYMKEDKIMKKIPEPWRSAYLGKEQKKQSKGDWGSELAWRLSSRSPDHDKLWNLLPVDGESRLDRKLTNVRMITLPSILELLQHGFDARLDKSESSDTGSDEDSHEDDDEYDGEYSVEMNPLPQDAFKDRHELLIWQHRMHPHIALFSHKHVYNEEALRTPSVLKIERKWEYSADDKRFVWIPVENKKTGKGSKGYSNKDESIRVIQEIEKFYKYARNHKRQDSMPWEVTVLVFYKDQEKMLRKDLQEFTKQKMEHSFELPPNKPIILIELRTVDSFQGHESDVVFISMANETPTMFLDNINRINVAVTRARYQCVIIGSQKLAKGKILGKLFKHALEHRMDKK